MIQLVLQIIAVIGLPILMMLVASSPFDEPIKVEPSDEVNSSGVEDVYVVFFVLWVIWILMLVRIVYQVRRGSFRIRTSISQRKLP